MKIKEKFRKFLVTTVCLAVFSQGLLVVNAMETAPNMAASSVSGNVVEPNVSGNVVKPSVSGNVVTPNVPSVTNQNGNSNVSTEIKPTNVITISGGKSITSSLSGIYIAKGVEGTAITTPKNNIASAIGLTNADTNIGFYVCDSYNHLLNKPLRDVVSTSGKQLVAFLNVDIYTITKQGVVSIVRSASSPVEIMFGIPSRFQNEDRDFSIISIDENGKTVVFEDVDSDNKTITINATVFGKYAIVY